mgnify:CR=1 FL=1
MYVKSRVGALLLARILAKNRFQQKQLYLRLVNGARSTLGAPWPQIPKSAKTRTKNQKTMESRFFTQNIVNITFLLQTCVLNHLIVSSVSFGWVAAALRGSRRPWVRIISAREARIFLKMSLGEHALLKTNWGFENSINFPKSQSAQYTPVFIPPPLEEGFAWCYDMLLNYTWNKRVSNMLCSHPHRTGKEQKYDSHI